MPPGRSTQIAGVGPLFEDLFLLFTNLPLSRRVPGMEIEDRTSVKKSAAAISTIINTCYVIRTTVRHTANEQKMLAVEQSF